MPCVCVLQEITLDFAVILGPQPMGPCVEKSLRPRASSASPVKWATNCGARPSGCVCSTGPGQDCSPCARVSGSQPESWRCRWKPGSSLWNDQRRSAKPFSFRLFLQLTNLSPPPSVLENHQEAWLGKWRHSDWTKEGRTLALPSDSPRCEGGVCLSAPGDISKWLCSVSGSREVSVLSWWPSLCGCQYVMAGGAENAVEGAVSTAGPDGAPCCWKTFHSRYFLCVSALVLISCTLKKSN